MCVFQMVLFKARIEQGQILGYSVHISLYLLSFFENKNRPWHQEERQKRQNLEQIGVGGLGAMNFQAQTGNLRSCTWCFMGFRGKILYFIINLRNLCLFLILSKTCFFVCHNIWQIGIVRAYHLQMNAHSHMLWECV